MEETVTDGISDVLAVKKSMLRTGTDTATHSSILGFPWWLIW